MPIFPSSTRGTIEGPRTIQYQSPQGFDDTPQIYSLTPAIGKTGGGLAVTITGFNFVADGSGFIDVKFDGIAATSVVVVNRQTITCVTPAGMTAGNVDVTVTIRTKTATLPGGFLAWEAVITSVEPSHGPISGGTTVSIKGAGFELGSTVTFDGHAATSVIFVDSGHLRCVTPAHAQGFVSVVVTGP
jgi:hypothetical protein